MSIPNLMHGSPWRQQLNVVNHAILNVQSCCYFFSLKMGCKLIVLFENILGLWQIYLGYSQIHDINRNLAPEWFSSNTTQHNSEFFLFLGLVAFFCAQLLLAGVVFVSITLTMLPLLKTDIFL